MSRREWLQCRHCPMLVTCVTLFVVVCTINQGWMGTFSTKPCIPVQWSSLIYRPVDIGAVSSYAGIANTFRLMEGLVKSPAEEIESFDDGHPTSIRAFVFVPGHRGSYGQSRPIFRKVGQLVQNVGALEYGRLELGPAREKPSSGGCSEDCPLTLRLFSLDYDESSSAFSSDLVLAQATFLEESIKFICKTRDEGSKPPEARDVDTHHTSCRVTLIGHSMGGIVSRVALVHSEYLTSVVDTLITISSPHQALPFTADSGLVSLYRELNGLWSLKSVWTTQLDQREDVSSYSTSGASQNGTDTLSFSINGSRARAYGGAGTMSARGISSKALSFATNASAGLLSKLLFISVAGGYDDKLVRSDLADVRGIAPPSQSLFALSTSFPDVYSSRDHLNIIWCEEGIHTIVSTALKDARSNYLLRMRAIHPGGKLHSPFEDASLRLPLWEKALTGRLESPTLAQVPYEKYTEWKESIGSASGGNISRKQVDTTSPEITAPVVENNHGLHDGTSARCDFGNTSALLQSYTDNSANLKARPHETETRTWAGNLRGFGNKAPAGVSIIDPPRIFLSFVPEDSFSLLEEEIILFCCLDEACFEGSPVASGSGQIFPANVVDFNFQSSNITTHMPVQFVWAVSQPALSECVKLDVRRIQSVNADNVRVSIPGINFAGSTNIGVGVNSSQRTIPSQGGTKFLLENATKLQHSLCGEFFSLSELSLSMLPVTSGYPWSITVSEICLSDEREFTKAAKVGKHRVNQATSSLHLLPLLLLGRHLATVASMRQHQVPPLLNLDERKQNANSEVLYSIDVLELASATWLPHTFNRREFVRAGTTVGSGYHFILLGHPRCTYEFRVQHHLLDFIEELLRYHSFTLVTMVIALLLLAVSWQLWCLDDTGRDTLRVPACLPASPLQIAGTGPAHTLRPAHSTRPELSSATNVGEGNAQTSSASGRGIFLLWGVFAVLHSYVKTTFATIETWSRLSVEDWSGNEGAVKEWEPSSLQNLHDIPEESSQNPGVGFHGYLTNMSMYALSLCWVLLVLSFTMLATNLGPLLGVAYGKAVEVLWHSMRVGKCVSKRDVDLEEVENSSKGGENGQAASTHEDEHRLLQEIHSSESDHRVSVGLHIGEPSLVRSPLFQPGSRVSILTLYVCRACCGLLRIGLLLLSTLLAPYLTLALIMLAHWARRTPGWPKKGLTTSGKDLGHFLEVMAAIYLTLIVIKVPGIIVFCEGVLKNRPLTPCWKDVAAFFLSFHVMSFRSGNSLPLPPPKLARPLSVIFFIAACVCVSCCANDLSLVPMVVIVPVVILLGTTKASSTQTHKFKG